MNSAGHCRRAGLHDDSDLTSWEGREGPGKAELCRRSGLDPWDHTAPQRHKLQLPKTLLVLR